MVIATCLEREEEKYLINEQRITSLAARTTIA